MKNIIYILLLILTFATCTNDRWFSEFELNEKTFDSDAMQYIEEISGLDIPKKSKGLKFYYKPPIDPCFIAKIEISQKDKNTIEKQLATFDAIDNAPGENWSFKDWWPKNMGDIIVMNIYYREENGYFFSYLVKENGRVILYLKHTTI